MSHFLVNKIDEVTTEVKDMTFDISREVQKNKFYYLSFSLRSKIISRSSI